MARAVHVGTSLHSTAGPGFALRQARLMGGVSVNTGHTLGRAHVALGSPCQPWLSGVLPSPWHSSIPRFLALELQKELVLGEEGRRPTKANECMMVSPERLGSWNLGGHSRLLMSKGGYSAYPPVPADT